MLSRFIHSTRTLSAFAVAGCIAIVFSASWTDAAEKKDKAAEWPVIFQTKGTGGGHKRFKLERDSSVQFIWSAMSSHRAPNFRITIAKRDPRTGDYNTLGVIVREHKNTQGKKLGKLKAGEYQLYIAVKRVHYEFKIKAEKGG